jgi:F0F1-type ATP synthase membrane subunit b/b'
VFDSVDYSFYIRRGIMGEDIMQTEESGAKVLVKPLPKILDDLDEHIRSAIMASREAQESARLAARAAADAIAAAKDSRESGEKLAQEAKKQAEEALAKAEEALVKAVIKRISQSEWIITAIVLILALVLGAVFLAVALVEAL